MRRAVGVTATSRPSPAADLAPCRRVGATKKLTDILCIYGYTLAVFVPISILCVLPSDLLRWALIFLGGGVSAVFLLSNFHAHLSDVFPYGEVTLSDQSTCAPRDHRVAAI